MCCHVVHRRLDATCKQAGEPSDARFSAPLRGGVERGVGGEQSSQAVIHPSGAEATVHVGQGGSDGLLQVCKLRGGLWVPRLEEPTRCLGALKPTSRLCTAHREEEGDRTVKTSGTQLYLNDMC